MLYGNVIWHLPAGPYVTHSTIIDTIIQTNYTNDAYSDTYLGKMRSFP
jgi:hypothetical protein